VKMHRVNIYRKCGGNTVIDLIQYGLAHGIICPEDIVNR
jgi:hypothetical protein